MFGYWERSTRHAAREYLLINVFSNSYMSEVVRPWKKKQVLLSIVLSYWAWELMYVIWRVAFFSWIIRSAQRIGNIIYIHLGRPIKSFQFSLFHLFDAVLSSAFSWARNRSSRRGSQWRSRCTGRGCRRCWPEMKLRPTALVGTWYAQYVYYRTGQWFNEYLHVFVLYAS